MSVTPPETPPQSIASPDSTESSPVSTFRSPEAPVSQRITRSIASASRLPPSPLPPLAGTSVHGEEEEEDPLDFIDDSASLSLDTLSPAELSATTLTITNISSTAEQNVSATLLQRFFRRRLRPTTMTTNIDCGSFTVQQINTANVAVAPPTVHKKTSRSKLSEDERVRLFELATNKMKSGQFKTLPIEISDPKQLSDFHSLDTLIKLCQEHCQTFDMADVFTILVPTVDMADIAADPSLKTDATGALVTHNLFTEYTTVTPNEVAKHCRWLHTWTDDSVDQMHANLQWSYHFLKHNIEPQLMSRLQQHYEKYDPLEQGGPLLFSLLLTELLYTNETSIKAITSQIEKYKISTLPGENVKVASAILLSVSRRIWFSKEQKFPDRFVDTIIAVLQTTSVPKFNAQFAQIESQRAREETEASVAALSGKTATTILSFSNDLASVEKLIAMATRFYDEYTRKEIWSIHVKGTKPTGAAMAAVSKCFNCGGNHHVEKCPLPIDNAKVEREKKKFQQEKRARRQQNRNGNGTNNNRPSDGNNSNNSNNGNSNGRSRNNASSNSGQSNRSNTHNNNNNSERGPDTRFRPPDNDRETHRFIWTKARGNQPYVWNSNTNHWDLQEAPAAANTAAATPAAQTAANTATAPSVDTDDKAAVRAQIAAMQQQLQRLTNQL